MSSESERWRQIDGLFEAALERSPEERQQFIADSCGGDDELRDAVESLVADSAASDDYWRDAADPLLERARTKLVSELPGQEVSEDPEQVGPYRLLERIGRGGMGTVYLAERADGEFEHRVAVKLLRRGLDTDDVVRRFLAERQILASLDHVNIARLLDGGTTGDGRPFVVMEHAHGVPITEYCDTGRLSIPERLALFEHVLRAVRHAHRHLVIHRDLKPSNILVTEDGVVKLLDFGIAKLLDDTDGGATGLTRTGVRLLTPGYASPEQLTGTPVTTASDVFQLGLLLYELITGVRPFGDSETSPQEFERRTLEAPVERPSRRIARLEREPATVDEGDDVAELAARRGTGPARWRRLLSGDLDDITEMALRKEPDERYASVDQFLNDLARYRDGDPVVASAGALRYRMSKFVGRNRSGVAAAAVLLLIAAGYVATLNVQSRRIAAERDRAQIEMRRAEQVTAFMTSVFGGADPGETLGDEVTAAELLERGAERVETELADEPELRAEMLHALGDAYRGLGAYDRASELLGQAVALRRQIYGSEHEKVAESLEKLGVVHSQVRNFAAAELPLEEALAIRRAVHDAGDQRVANAAANLAVAYVDLGRTDEAEALMRESVESSRVDPGPDSIEYVNGIATLARVLRTSGDLTGAEALYREALPKQRELFGPGSTQLMSTLNNLGYLLKLRGELAEAAQHYREALDLHATIYGRGHPNTLIISNNLGVVFRDQGDIVSMVALNREDVEAAVERWPGGHWRVGATYQSLGIALLQSNDYAEADTPLAEAVRIYDEQLGPFHSWTARAGAWLATSHALQERHEEAARVFDVVLTTLRPIAADRGFPDSERVEIETFADFLEERGLSAWSEQFRALLGEGG